MNDISPPAEPTRGTLQPPAQDIHGGYAAPDDEIDLGEYLGILLDHKWFIALITAIAVFLGGAFAILSTPIYQADALLHVEEKGTPFSALENVASLFEGETPVSGEIEIIGSRMVLGTVVDNLGLDIEARPRHFPLIGRGLSRFLAPDDGGVARPWFELAQFAWGGEEIEVDSLQVPRHLEGEKLRLVAGEAGRYALFDPDDNLLLEGRVGERAERGGAGDAPVRLFVSLLKARPGTEFRLVKYSRLEAFSLLSEAFSVKERGKQSGVLQLSLEGDDRARIVEVLNEITDIYVRRNVERRSEEAEKTLAFLEQQLPPLRQQLEAAEVAYNSYRLEHGSVDLAQETKSVLDQVVKTDAELIQLQQQREELRQKFKPAHPTLLALDAKISRLKGKSGELESEVGKLPDTQQDVLRLARDVEVNTALYTQLLNTAQELRVAKAGTVANARIVDYALEPDKAVKPKKGLVVAVAFVGGLFFSVILVFVRRALTGGVEDPDEIERHVNLPVYASVPHSIRQDKLARLAKKHKGHAAILALVDPEDQAIESLRSLRTTIHFAMMEASNNVIQITGPSPGVGKSFISLNLGAVLASAGKRVLLIDADIRKGFLHRYLGLAREGGLSEIISGELEWVQGVRQTAVQGMDVITTGKIPPNPAELLLHENFGHVMRFASRAYDYVIVDAPPILAVTDAAIVGRQAGATLMVVKAGQHPIREIDQAVKRLRQAGVNLKGVVFNNVELWSTRYRYGYGRYVYQYAYGKKS